MEIETIDNGSSFDFGKVSKEYAKYRDIYPQSMYQKLVSFGIGREGQKILDLGTGTGAMPRNLYYTKAKLWAADISENQIKEAIHLSNGKEITYKVCPCDKTGFADESFDVVIACQCFQYFNKETFIPELKRILKSGGRFCKTFMTWLPFEDEIAGEVEKLILKYNPSWNGSGYRRYNYSFPDWAKESFDFETAHFYDEKINFTKEAWRGRVRVCRGVGASLSKEKVEAFDNEYKTILAKYPGDILQIRHHITIEIYKLKEIVK